MIIFRRLRWRNFLSYGNDFTELDLSTHATTLIVGENGVGKSTFIDALCFVLYNRPFRDINKPQLVNSITEKNLEVEVEFQAGGKEYLIRRGIKPNIFEIYRDNELVDQTSASADYQSILEKQILKMNFKAFTQIIILGSDEYVPFMKLPAAARREVIEDILDIQIFSTMNTLLKERIAANKDAITETELALTIEQNRAKDHEKYLQRLKSVSGAQIETLQLQKKVYENEYEEVSADLIEIKQVFDVIETKISTTRNKLEQYQEVSSLRHKKEYEKSEAENWLKFYEDHTECPECAQRIPQGHQSNMIKIISTQINEVTSYLSDLAKLEDKASKVKERLKLLEAQRSQVNQKLVMAVERQKTLEGLIASTDTSIASLGQQSEEHQEYDDQNLKALETSLSDLLEEREILAVAGVLLKDGGIKTRIIRQYIPIINQLLNQYLADLDLFVGFELDENFKETIRSRYRDTFSYGSFSNGQKQRINLAILFTWRKIAQLRHSAETNLLIMDEILDGPLDAKGIDHFVMVLKGVLSDKNTIIISHEEQLIDKFDRVVHFDMNRHFSRMKT